MKLTVRELVQLALLSAIMIVGKQLMAALPNIEPVTLIFMAAALVYGPKAFYICAVFVPVQGLLYGFGLWFYCYIYIWSLLVVIVLLLKKVNSSYVVWTIVAALFGLVFGALCSLPYLFIGGPSMAFGYWISGLPYDLLHCAGNAVMCGVLLRPLTMLLQKLTAK